MKGFCPYIHSRNKVSILAKKNHHSLKYKMETQPNKTYKDLKQKRKWKISEWMFREVCDYYRGQGVMPPDEEIEQLAKKVFVKIQGEAIRVPYEDVLNEFIQKQSHFAERISTQGLPEPPVPKQKKTEAEKLAIKRTQRRNRQKKGKERLAQERTNTLQNDDFFFIAGYTSGGAPYGVTWDEMGLKPWQQIDDVDEE